MNWPDGKRFAFSIIDDTDLSVLQNIQPVYDFLTEQGLRTTKTVWTLPPDRPARLGGDTLLGNNDYRDYVLELQRRGFEIAFHNATSHESVRENTILALEKYREIIGQYPKVFCNHSSNREGLYWGSERLQNPLPRFVHHLSTFSRKWSFEGHLEGSPYFWGDYCKKHIKYVRGFGFRNIDLLPINPTIPYRHPAFPYVNYWFSTVEGSEINSFCQLLSDNNQDRLEEGGGLCLVTVHFACGFWDGQQLAPAFRECISRLARRNGWFVPVSQILDHLLASGRGGDIPEKELATMERQWMHEKLRAGLKGLFRKCLRRR